MKITVEIDVFDDPEYCEINENECDKLINRYARGIKTRCSIFNERLDFHGWRHLKCDECKKAYSEAQR